MRLSLALAGCKPNCWYTCLRHAHSCIKLSPFDSLAHYRFATSKALKTRPGPEGCKTAPLRTRLSLFVVVFPRF